MTGFSSLLCHLFPVPLVDVHGDHNNDIERVVDVVRFGESVLDEGGQVLPVPD